MMKAGKRAVSICLVIFLMINLSGCSLAYDEGNVETTVGNAKVGSEDKLIGGLLTRNPIQKAFAAYEWIKPINAPGRPDEVQFERIEGMLFYGYETMLYGVENELFIVGDGDDINVNGRIEENGGKREISLYAETYYVPKTDKEAEQFYLNPVYETPDREIYVLPSEEAPGIKGGDTHTLSFKQESKRTLLDDTEVEGFEIHVKIERIEEPIHIWMYQMTKEDEVIKKEEFFPKEMSGELAIEEETAYVLVETETRLQKGKTVMKREIIDWEGETMNSLDENDNEIAAKSASYFSYYPVVDGFFGKAWTYITWPE